MRRGTRLMVEVRPRIPEALARLEEIANDLWYSWNRSAREVFARVHPELWEQVHHSPKSFLRQVDEERLLAAAADPEYVERLARMLEAYDGYLADTRRRGEAASYEGKGPIGYFCAEFGLHESFPMYSGGLGILAGDHCKAASDQRLPFVGVGLLYRQGYFAQTLDADGNQIVEYPDNDFDHQPVTLLQRDGADLRVSVDLPGRKLWLRIWEARAGHVRLYLLDTDFDANAEADRDITHRLYGGDRVHRLEQEIALGIGGTRALAALGIEPSVWHINEGHAAFLILERARGLVASGATFAAALEAVASNVVFTTHTAVPAGHDRFDAPLMDQYFAGLCRDLRIDSQALLALGSSSEGPGFNMTALAVRGSRSHNGVSRIHAGVTSRMLQELWPQVSPTENPVGYVTNGVHVPTFLAPEWSRVFHDFFGDDWAERPVTDFAVRLSELPDDKFWSVHQQLKVRTLDLVRKRMRERHLRNQGSEPHLDRLLRLADPGDPNVLTIGFARRFATYKRAAMIFEDLDLTRALLGDRDRPVLLLFAGKAHPADTPGQDVIRKIARIAAMPEFEGKVLLLEGYDLYLAKHLVSGVDVWLNNPVFPLEASGTSGMKAGMNGVLNLSVLDGWWGEGYEPGNGWAIRPAAPNLDPASRDREEARTLYEILQDQVIPLYYARDGRGRSEGWIAMQKSSIATLLPRFNASRMLNEYIQRFYLAAEAQGRRFAADNLAPAAELHDWKVRVRNAWPQVELKWIDTAPRRTNKGERLRLQAAIRLAGLRPEDVRVELLFERAPRGTAGAENRSEFLFAAAEPAADGWHRFVLDFEPPMAGQLEYSLRAYPFHTLLAHRFEMGLTTWA